MIRGFLASLVFGLSLTSCGPTVRPTIVAPVGPKTEKRESAADTTDQRQKELDTKRDSRDSKVAASLESISSVTENPATPAEDVANRESKLAITFLNFKPFEVDRVAAAERKNLALQGEKKATDAAYLRAESDARKLTADLALKQKELDAAKSAEDLAKADAEQERQTSAKKVQGALSAARNAEARRQALILNVCGAGMLVIFGLAIGFGGLQGIRFGWIFGLLSLLCFGLAQLISQWWFKYGVLAVVVIGVVLVGIWVYRHWKQGDLHAAAEDKAAKLSTFAHEVVPVLDRAYEEADAATKQVLDSSIFSKLSNLMDKSTKALVHEIRAK